MTKLAITSNQEMAVKALINGGVNIYQLEDKDSLVHLAKERNMENVIKWLTSKKHRK